jgi:DNA primase
MRYTDTCLFAFDPDNAGSKALKKSVELCQTLGMKYGRFNLPEGADPAAYLLGGEN